MALIRQTDYVQDNPVGLANAPTDTPRPDPFKEDKGFWDALLPSLRVNNTVGSTINAAMQGDAPAMTPDDNHNPLDLIRGTPYDQYRDRFLGSPNETYTRWLMGRIDKEMQDRRAISEAGWEGVAAGLLSGAVDPLFWLPGAAYTRLLKGTTTLGALGRATAVGAAQGVASEGIMQGQQLTRGLDESIVNIGVNAILFGVLGSAARGMEPLEAQTLTRELEYLRGSENPAADLGAPSGTYTPPATPQATAGRPLEGGPLEPAGTGVGQSVGAAGADPRRLEPESFGGAERVPVLRWFVEGVTPTMRTFSQQASRRARQVMADLAPPSITFREAAEGVPPNFGGTVWQNVRLGQVQARMRSNDILSQNWSEYFYGPGQAPRAPVVRSNINQLLGRSDDRLSYLDFKKAVWDAMDAGGKHENPYVSAAAQQLKADVVDPLVARAKKAGIFGEDMENPRNAEGWAPFDWAKNEVAQRRPEFVERVADWYMRQQEIKADLRAQIDAAATRHESAVAAAERIEKRLATLDQKVRDVGQRLSERNMEARAAGARAETMDVRAAEIGEQISELKEAIDELKQIAQGPEGMEPLRRLEDDLRSLEREAKPISQAELDRLARMDIAEVLPNEMRKAAEVLLGRRKAPEMPRFLAYIVDNGGIKDTGGDVTARTGDRWMAIGKDGTEYRATDARSDRRLIVQDDAPRDLDDWGEKLGNDFPEYFDGRHRIEPDEVMELIESDLAGSPPEFWADHFYTNTYDGEVAAALKLFDEMEGLDLSNATKLRDVADQVLLAYGENPRVLDRLLEKAEAERGVEQVRPIVETQRKIVKEWKQTLDQARADAKRMGVNERVAKGKAGEAAVADRRNRGRLSLLQDRLDRQEELRRIYRETLDLTTRRGEAALEEVEELLQRWEGKSARSAQGELKRRAKAYEERAAAQAEGSYNGAGKRLRSADKAVQDAVRKIRAKPLDLSRDEMLSRADVTANQILGSPDGRLGYDDSSGMFIPQGPDVDPAAIRGSAMEREFAIPSSEIRDFLNRDIEGGLEKLYRTLLPDVELKEKFGDDVLLTRTLKEVEEEFAAAARRNPEQAQKIENQRKQVREDLAATRDRIRGLYGWSPDAWQQRIGRAANVALVWNAVTMLGSAVANSASDLAAVTMRHGVNNVFRDAWLPFAQHMVGMKKGVYGHVKEQMKALGIVSETVMNMRMHDIMGVLDQYAPGSGFERGARWAGDKFQLANLQAPWTDMTKTLAASTIMARVMRAARMAAEGKLHADEAKAMTSAGLTPRLLEQIWREAQQGNASTEIKGVRLANFQDWPDSEAKRAFISAIDRDVNISVVTPGAEKPLLMSTPIMAMVLQFKSFIAAAHERVLLAQLQQRDAKTLSGLMFMLGSGMLSYRAYTLVSGRDVSDDPSQWLKEAINRSGVAGWFDEFNAISAKATGGVGDMYRLVGADKPLSRYSSRSIVGSLMGPMAGKIQDTAGVARSASYFLDPTKERELNAGDLSSVRRLLPFQNAFYLRLLFDEVEDGVARNLGIDPKTRN